MSSVSSILFLGITIELLPLQQSNTLMVVDEIAQHESQHNDI